MDKGSRQNRSVTLGKGLALKVKLVWGPGGWSATDLLAFIAGGNLGFEGLLDWRRSACHSAGAGNRDSLGKYIITN